MNYFVNQYISRRKKIMKKTVKSIRKGCYIINVVLTNAYITSRGIDSAVMELEEWKINHAGRPAGPARPGLVIPVRKKPDWLQLCLLPKESKMLIKTLTNSFDKA
jgi:hypothetical protein